MSRLRRKKEGKITRGNKERRKQYKTTVKKMYQHTTPSPLPHHTHSSPNLHTHHHHHSPAPPLHTTSKTHITLTHHHNHSVTTKLITTYLNTRWTLCLMWSLVVFPLRSSSTRCTPNSLATAVTSLCPLSPYTATFSRFRPGASHSAFRVLLEYGVKLCLVQR